jgi:hypothetical protein
MNNGKKLLELNKSVPIAKVKAINKGVHACNTSSSNSGCLSNEVHICVGAKVQLSVNLNVQHGLFNRASGTVIDCIYGPGKRPPMDQPDVVMVEFHQYSGPAFINANPRIIPIVPVTRPVDCPCGFCMRTTIPLRLGWSTTLHSCQGMTVGVGQPNRYIVINPGTRKFESNNPGALFVALSRAKSAGSSETDPDFAWNPNILVNPDRLCFAPDTNLTRLRREEIARLERLAERTKEKYSGAFLDEEFQQFLHDNFHDH